MQILERMGKKIPLCMGTRSESKIDSMNTQTDVLQTRQSAIARSRAGM